MSDKITHEHDCDCCTFLGNYKDEFATYDLYHCDQQGLSKRPTVVARYGVDGDYLSGLSFAIDAHNEKGRNDVWSEMYSRAKAKGLNVKMPVY